MSKRLIGSLFSSGLQAIAIQVLGVAFFYVTSIYLTKESFGFISWTNAVSISITTVLSMGLEQVVVRRIALSKNNSWPAAAYFFHAFLLSLIAISTLLLVFWFASGSTLASPLFLCLFSVQALIFTASPIKQYLNARENFTPFGIIAIISNLAKLAIVFYIVSQRSLDTKAVGGILLGTAIFELVALLIFARFFEGFKLSFRVSAYKKLVKEALPQYFSVLFDIGLSRMDWILLGILSTSAITADYSFAYRAFEIAKLPLVIVGPVILPKFARLMARGRNIEEQTQTQLYALFSTGVFLMCALALLLNFVWSPWVSLLTHGKYGSSNAPIFLLLSFCLPLHFIINFLWTLSFSAKKFKQVSTITVISSVVNLVLNVILIPKLNGFGAAIAFLGATVAQMICYLFLVRNIISNFPIKPIIYLGIIAIVSFVLSSLISDAVAVKIISGLIIYVGLAVTTTQIGKKHIQTLTTLF